MNGTIQPASYSTIGQTLAQNALKQYDQLRGAEHYQDARTALIFTGDTIAKSPETTETEKILGRMCRAVSATTMNSETAASMNAAVLRVINQQVAGTLQNALVHAALNVVNCGGNQDALIFGSRAAATIASETPC
jgi:hypothetical protein